MTTKMQTDCKAHKLYLLLCAGLILFGIILGLLGRGQIHLIPGLAGSGLFHFGALKTFTYQSNLLLVVGFLAMAMMGENKARHYISASVMLGAIVTGLVYNFLLFPIAGAPIVFSNYVNFSTHLLVMIFPLANYIIFEKKGLLTLRHILAATIFPALYWAIFVTIGERINFFPYFFMNHPLIGWPNVILWFVILLAFFAGLGFLLILFDRRQGKRVCEV